MKTAGIIIIIIILLAAGAYFLFFKKVEKKEAPVEPEGILPMEGSIKKKIAMIIASKDFRDEEYFVPREIFDKAGTEVKVISDELGTAKGADGNDVEVDIKLSDLNVSDFDVVVFIGGPGALTYLDNEDSYRIAKYTIAQNKILSAICISPMILAKAGVLQGKKATVWTSALDKSAKKILEDNGAIFQDEDVVQDNNIVTANNPSAAKKFANKILAILK